MFSQAEITTEYDSSCGILLSNHSPLVRLQQRSTAPTIAGNFRLGGQVDRVPPFLPAFFAVQAPVKVRSQEAQLVGPGQSGMGAKTGMQPGEVFRPPPASQPPVTNDPNQVDEPDGNW